MEKFSSVCLFAVLLSAFLFPTTAESQNAEASPVSSFAWLTGNWNCDGKFAKSGKAISADVSFAFTLDKHWMLFRHDDGPPFNYHALSEWGWDAKSRQFTSTIQDSTGGQRFFTSSGWNGSELVWQGGALLPERSAAERFTFTRVDADHFQVAYSFQRDGGWIPVDTSVCSRNGNHDSPK